MMRLFKYVFASFVALLIFSTTSFALSSTFNNLVLEKAELENRSAVKTLECFPFIENIGFMDDQRQLVRNCLKGLRTLKAALDEIPDAEYHTVGISNRYQRSGGFRTILIPWDARKLDLMEFLRKQMPVPQQELYLKKIYDLKKKISEELWAGPLYCTLKISNEQCLRGYETLAQVSSRNPKRKILWREIVLTDSFNAWNKPFALTLKFDASPDAMLEYIQRDPQSKWSVRKKMYEKIESLYGEELRKHLQLANIFCAPNLTESQCIQGAENLHGASANPELQKRFWSEVMIDLHNTIIKDDFNLIIRFDLSPDQVVQHFSQRSTSKESTENTVLVEKLDKRSKNNPSRLRPVCDLLGLRTSLCRQAFENFVDFVSNHRDFRAVKPWTEMMFVDGKQLARVNFALNSIVRNSYIYVDANSNREEFEDFIMRFKQGGS